MENNQQIFIALPLDDIIALRGFLKEFPLICDEVKVLSRRLDGCYSLQSECMQKIGDLSRR